MLIHFWGVRGSIPTPLTPQQIQSKIMAAIQRATPQDLESLESRSKFVSSLPNWIFGTTGGNTACVEIKSENNELLFDAGSGIRCYGKSNKVPEDKHFNLFFSHFHWDHIQGFPFFDHAFNPETQFDIYSPWENAETIFRNQVIEPYSPPSVSKSITKKLNFYSVEPGKSFFIDDIKVDCCKMNHPGDSYSYSFEVAGRKVVYATDVELDGVELNDNSNCYSKENANMKAVFENADVVILDSQYTVEEAALKKNWGHTAFCYAIDFAIKWNIKSIYLFHHEPMYDDKKLNSILQAARWYAQYINHSDIKIYLAKEGHEIKL